MRPSGHLFAIASTIALGVSGVRAAGVAVLKEQVYHRDSTASAVAYTRIIDSHGPYLRIVSGGTNVDITRSKLIEQIELPDKIPEFIQEENDIASLRRTLADLRRFAVRYPRSMPLLETTISSLASHISHFEAGEIHFEGAWISPRTYADILDSRRRENEAIELVEVEKRIFAANQRDKGLVLHDGKWLTKQEVEQLPADAPTEISDCVTPVWNGELQGARYAVDNLTRLASTQTGAPKVRTERLATVIRNLFAAESQLSNQLIARAVQTQAAAIHEENAKNWRKPNAFGTVKKDAARESAAKAARIRKHSNEELDVCKQALMTQLRETEIVAADFLKLREQRVVMILRAAVRAVAARNFPGDEFTPASPDASQASISKPPHSDHPAAVDFFQ